MGLKYLLFTFVQEHSLLRRGRDEIPTSIGVCFLLRALGLVEEPFLINLRPAFLVEKRSCHSNGSDRARLKLVCVFG